MGSAKFASRINNCLLQRPLNKMCCLNWCIHWTSHLPALRSLVILVTLNSDCRLQIYIEKSEVSAKYKLKAEYMFVTDFRLLK